MKEKAGKKKSRKRMVMIVCIALPIIGLVLWSLSGKPDLEMKKGELFEEESIYAITWDAFTLVEEHWGKEFSKKPTLNVTTVREEINERRMLSAFWLRNEHPNMSAEDMKKALNCIAIPSWCLGLYNFQDHSITLFWKRIQRLYWYVGYLPEVQPRVLRMLLVHETVHAMDEDRHGRLSKNWGETFEERAVYRALIEGHAEYVTQQIMEKTGDWAICKRLHEFIRESKEDDLHFPYYRGRIFFLELAKRGRAGFVEKVFESPPKTKEQILHPEKYVILGE
jgi:hypothetical protein